MRCATQRARTVAAERGCAAIATAHNRDDQAETILYRLAKYASPQALVGMRPREAGASGAAALARPLLCLGAGEVREYCRARADRVRRGRDQRRARVRAQRRPPRDPAAARGAQPSRRRDPRRERRDRRRRARGAERSSRSRHGRGSPARGTRGGGGPRPRRPGARAGGASRALPARPRPARAGRRRARRASRDRGLARLVAGRDDAGSRGAQGRLGGGARRRPAAPAPPRRAARLRTGLLRPRHECVRWAAGRGGPGPVLWPPLHGGARRGRRGAVGEGRRRSGTRRAGLAQRRRASRPSSASRPPAARVTLGIRDAATASRLSAWLARRPWRAFSPRRASRRRPARRAPVLDVDGDVAWVGYEVVAGKRLGEGCAAPPRDREYALHAPRRRGGRVSDPIAKVLVTPEELEARVDELARPDPSDYAGEELLLVGVLKGAVFFMADLARRIDRPLRPRLHGRLELRLVDRLVRRRAHPQGPRQRDRGPSRAHRRGHHRLGPHAELPAQEPALAQAGLARDLRPAHQAVAAPHAASTAATSASRSPTSSSSATASTTPSTTARSTSSACSRPRRRPRSPARTTACSELSPGRCPRPRRATPAVVAARLHGPGTAASCVRAGLLCARRGVCYPATGCVGRARFRLHLRAMRPTSEGCT